MLLFLRLPTLLAKWWRRSLGQDREAKTGSRRNLSFIVFRLDALGDAVMTTPDLSRAETVLPRFTMHGRRARSLSFAVRHQPSCRRDSYRPCYCAALFSGKATPAAGGVSSVLEISEDEAIRRCHFASLGYGRALGNFSVSGGQCCDPCRLYGEDVRSEEQTESRIRWSFRSLSAGRPPAA